MNLLLIVAAAPLSPETAPLSTFPLSVEGSIEATDPLDPGYGEPYDDYRLLLTAGTRYRFTASPSGATETLMLRLHAPGEDIEFATDSVFGPNQRDAQLTFGPQTTGAYVLRVSSILGRGSGPPSAPYRLTIVPLAAGALAPAPATTRPATWRVWQGALTGADPDDIEDRHFHEYRLRLAAGRDTIVMAERISPGASGTPDEGHNGLLLTIRAAEAPDDAFEHLAIGAGSPTGPAVAAARPERSGDYIVRVSAPVADAAVPYRLKVSE